MNRTSKGVMWLGVALIASGVVLAGVDLYAALASRNASAADVIGQDFSRFYTEEDRQAGLPQHALTTATEEDRYEAEGWRVRKDGSRFWASVIIDRVTDASGRVRGFAKITRDITEPRQRR